MNIGKIASVVVAASAALSAFADFTPPAEDFDVLIYTRWQYVHNWKTGEIVPKGAFHHLSTEAGAVELDRHFKSKGYRTFVTDDPKVFDPEAFKRCKCVIFQCTNHEQFETDAQRQAFYAWAKAGGGTVGIHSASANERGRKEWLEFLGGAFVYHYAPHPVPFKGADRSHPAIACLPEDYVWAKDEIYVHKVTKDARVLLKLPSAAIPENEKEWARKTFKVTVGSEDYDLEWVKDFGKGRVFFTALGHFPADFKKPEWLNHILKAAEWTMRKGEAK